MGSSPSTPTFAIQIVSDIHLEFDGDTDIGEPTAPYLALLGDIGNCTGDRAQQLTDYLRDCCKRYTNVFFVCGNHEFYHGSIREVNLVLRGLASEIENFIFLDCDSFDVPGTDVRLLGCTLWSDISDAGTNMLNDFNFITELLQNPGLYSEIYHRQVAWLEEECKRACEEKKRVVVLTHHGPIVEGLVPTIYGVDSGLLKAGCLGSSLVPDRFSSSKFPGLQAWCYGHTHLSKRAMVGGVAIISNQMGYPNHSWGQWAVGKLVWGYVSFDATYKLTL